jgi:tetratricopeptide (TPR) repeat protein
MSEDLGTKLQIGQVGLVSGPVEMLAGDHEAAEQELRRDYELLREIGDRAYFSTVAAQLAQVMCETGRPEEALRLSEESERAASPDDVETQVLWRCAKGKVLSGTGASEAAEALLREAVDLIFRTEEPQAQGLVLMDLAQVLREAGRTADASREVARALELFESKGDLPSAGRARAILGAAAGTG